MDTDEHRCESFATAAEFSPLGEGLPPPKSVCICFHLWFPFFASTARSGLKLKSRSGADEPTFQRFSILTLQRFVLLPLLQRHRRWHEFEIICKILQEIV